MSSYYNEIDPYAATQRDQRGSRSNLHQSLLRGSGMSDADIIKNQRERIEELEEELRQIKDDLSPKLTIPLEWKLTATEEAAFMRLLTRPLCSRVDLTEALPKLHGADYENGQMGRMYVYKLRSKLAPLGITITTNWGRGYSIPHDLRVGLLKKLGGGGSITANFGEPK